MGHAKVDTTLNVYTQVIDESKRIAAQRIGDELFTIVHSPDGTTELSPLKGLAPRAGLEPATLRLTA